MPTVSITKRFVIKDDETCQRLIDAFEKFETSADKKQEIKSGPSILERGRKLLALRYGGKS